MNSFNAGLVRRDPALASLMGLMSIAALSSISLDDRRAAASDFGQDPGPTPGSPQEMLDVWQKHRNDSIRSGSRAALLEPNKGSAVRVEKYVFGLSQVLTLATGVAINQSLSPDCVIRPQRVTTNAPCPGFSTMTELKIANTSIIIGGQVDSYDFAAHANGSELDMPTLSPANRALWQGQYSGLLPTAVATYLTATPYIHTLSLKGPASVAA